MTGALVQKDLRLLRPVMLAAVGVALTFYVVMPSIAFASWHKDHFRINHSDYPNPSFDYPRRFAQFVADGCMQVWTVDVVLIAAVSAMAFAKERHDRSADFLAMLPISIPRQSSIKLATSAAVCIFLLAVNGMIFLVATLWFAQAHWRATSVYGHLVAQAWPVSWRVILLMVCLVVLVWIELRRVGRPSRLSVAAAALVVLLTADVVGMAWWMGSQSGGVWFNPRAWSVGSLAAVIVYLGIASSVFGLAWLFSSATRSSVLSAVFGLGLPLFVLTAINEATRRLEQTPILLAAGVAGVALGALGVAAGCVVQSKRPTP